MFAVNTCSVKRFKFRLVFASFSNYSYMEISAGE